MRKKMSLAVVGLLAGATLSVGSPAQAQPTTTGCTAHDPVLAYVCSVLNNAPQPGPTVQYYYELAGRVVKAAYCKVWPSDPSC